MSWKDYAELSGVHWEYCDDPFTRSREYLFRYSGLKLIYVMPFVTLRDFPESVIDLELIKCISKLGEEYQRGLLNG